MRNGKGLAWLSAVGALGVAIAGCGGPPAGGGGTGAPEASPTASGSSSNDIPDLSKEVQAGVDVKMAPTPVAALANAAWAKYGPARPDPFALEPAERQFDTEQNTERVFNDIGAWQNEFTPTNPFEQKPPPPVEAQPYRRLAGVVIGDSIVALITMEDGNSYIIYPGEQLPSPYNQWTVKSIDMDEGVLERSSGNPRQVTVRLELPPAGAAGAPGAGGPPFGGGPPGGFGGPGRPPGFGGGPGAPGGVGFGGGGK